MEKHIREREQKKLEEKPQDDKANTEENEHDFYMGDDNEEAHEEEWPDDDQAEPSAKRVKG